MRDAAREGQPMPAELVSITRNPAPSGAVTGAIVASDGATIRFARWPSTAEPRLGTVCLFPGRAEFIEKYFETITDLRRRGFAVAIMDWRGQGGSSRLLSNTVKGHAESFAHHDEDLRRFMVEIVLPDCPPPYFALAHSMGAHLILRSAQTRVCWFDRIVLVSPMIRFRTPGNFGIRCAVAEAATLLGLGDLFIPGGKPDVLDPAGFEGNQLTSDRLRYERACDVLKAAPHLGIGAPTIGWVAAACASVNYLHTMQFMEKVRVPILIVAAGNDGIVSTEATESYAARLKNCTRVVLSGAKHELLQERDELREQFWAAFDAYVPGSARMPREMEQGGRG
jgi:lysophospholipase